MSRYFQYARMNLTEIAEYHNLSIEEAELIVDGDADKAKTVSEMIQSEKKSCTNQQERL